MNNWELNAATFNVLRAPYLPEETIDVLSNGSLTKDNSKSIKQSLQQLIKISNQKDIIQAIEFASSSLGQKIHQLTDELTIENMKLASSIYKYMTRMATRSTPFGAFSSVMTLENSDKSNLKIDKNIQLYIRLDNGCVLELARIAQKQAIKNFNQDLLLRKNSSMYLMGEEVRFVSEIKAKDYIDFKLDEATYSDAIHNAMQYSDDWISVADLVSELTKSYKNVEKQQLKHFVFDLLDNQLLESNLCIVLTSNNSFIELIDRARLSNINEELVNKMQHINDLLSSITSLEDKSLKNKLGKAESELIELLPDYDIKHWLHVDSFRRGQGNTIAQNIYNPLIKTINGLSDFFWKPNKAIQEFTNKFTEVYGESEVRLLEALDIDNGIPFGQKRLGRSPLLNGVMPMKITHAINIDWSPMDQFMMTKIIDAISNKNPVVQIKSKEIEKYKEIQQKPARFNDSITLHGSLLEDENGKVLYKMNSIAGPSALMLFGRFCCGSEELEDACKLLAEQEQYNDDSVIYAEIVHMAQARAANVSCRPSLRAKEVIYGPGDSGLNSCDQINCNDLYLRVVSGRLQLYSKKLNKEIKPRLASAHNTGGLNLPIYQFLHALQGVDGWYAGLSLNGAIDSLPYIPEIRIDNVIFFERRWIISREEILTIHKGKTDDDKINKLKSLIVERNISRYIALSEGDNNLDFDLNTPFSALLFINEVKNKESVKLIASLKGRTNKLFNMGGHTYRHEFVVPCFAKSINNISTNKIDNNIMSIEQAKDITSLPCETWKYLKIYTGEASADKLLANHLAPLANWLKKEGHIKKWFYIRYQDPDSHIRVRFELAAAYQTDVLNQILYKPLKLLYKQGLIQNIVEDSYFPEVGRYGGTEILPICEDLFYLNSVLVSEVVKLTFADPNKDEIRWKICLRFAWQLTMEVCESLEHAEQFFKAVAASYDNEFNSDGNAMIKKKLSLNYREAMKDVANALHVDNELVDSSLTCQAVFAEYSKKLSQLKQLCKTNDQDVMALLQSLIHMDCNRVFVIGPRANEWIIYNYLAKYIRTVIARKFVLGKDVISGFYDKTTRRSLGRIYEPKVSTTI